MKRILPVLIMLAALSVSGNAQAVLLTYSPMMQTIGLGSSFDTAIVIEDLGSGSAPSLGVFDIAATYDPGILSLTGATLGDPVLGDQLDLLGFGAISIITPGVGSLGLFELSLDPSFVLDALQASSFTLATLTFDALALGSTSLGFGPVLLGDAIGFPIIAELKEGSVEVAEVPEPGAIVLALSGVLFLFLFFALFGAKGRSKGERTRTVV